MHGPGEHVEHAGHEADPKGGHAGGGMARWIGITIAVLGVIMAVCSAQVGAARTELIATMVDQTGASLQYQSVSGKYRTLQAQLQQLHAVMPDPGAQAKLENEIKEVESQAKNPDTVQGIKVARLETKRILNTVTPTKDDVLRFTKLIRRYREESEAAKEWAGSYKDAIHVHEVTAARFEVSQVAAEFGVIVASVGLLLSAQRRFSMIAWILAIVLGVTSLSVAGGTWMVNHQKLHGAEEKIEKTREHFHGMSKEKEDQEEDEKLLKEIERDIEKLTVGS